MIFFIYSIRKSILIKNPCHIKRILKSHFLMTKIILKNNLNDHMIFKNKSMFGRKYLTEVNVYFPYHNIFFECFPHFTETSNKG